MDLMKARYWHRLDHERIQCDLCPRFCKLKEGDRGLCFVRQSTRDAMELTTYGRSSGFCVDPIEKKPLYHFLPGSPILSFGTAGCNLTCPFCQNWDISKSKEMDSLMAQASPRRIAQVAKEEGCPSVAFTYNDPTIFIEYAMDTADACHELGLKTVAVTAGYITPEPRRDFFSKLDAANVDLKSFREEFYRKMCSAHLAPILETLEYIKKETSCWLEITTLLIPDENDSEEELTDLCEWVFSHLGADVPLHFSAFHPDYKLLNRAATPQLTLERARKIALNTGLHYVYLGNVHDPEADSTYCPNCRHQVIHRDWYQILESHLDPQGRCINCHTQISGVYQGPVGHWGRRRKPISMN